MAAAFLDVGKTTFREGYQGGRYPRPIREGRRLFWSRLQLERFVEAQFGLTADNDDGDGTWGDLRG